MLNSDPDCVVGNEYRESEGLVVLDNACTGNIIGRKEIPFCVNVRQVPAVKIFTANGITHSSDKGTLTTESGSFEGYLVPESEYSLMSLKQKLVETGESIGRLLIVLV